MTTRLLTSRALAAAALLAACGLARFARAAETEPDAAWASDLAEAMHYDGNVELAQAAAPADSDSQPTTRSSYRTARTSRVPYMIGDQSIGLSGGLAIGGVGFGDFEHPIFGGNRLNVAENGAVLPTDRVFFTYRHFSNAYETSILGQNRGTDVERFDLGLEETAFDGLISCELRLPLLRQLNTDLDIYDSSDGSSGPLTDRHGELGNLGVNFKLSLINRSPFALTAGVGVNCPTADDARIAQDYDDSVVPIFADSPSFTTAPTDFTLIGRFNNQTVNLVPYLAWNARPTDRFFHQGFLQIDAPINRSTATISVDGQITPDAVVSPSSFSVQESGELDQQTLLRLNLGFGYWICQGERGGALRGLAGIFECHYTAALEDANPFIVPVTELDNIGTGPNVPVDVLAGPIYSDINQVNLTAGVAANFASCQVTNGFIVPVTENENRSFDFEYSLQVNRRF